MSELIDEAFEKIDRSNFVLPGYEELANFDIALPIGHGQTISQPTTVRLMLEWLDPKLGQKILDVGSGSGWSTALLSHIVGLQGKVYAVEKIPELKDFGKKNCQRIGIENAEFFVASSEIGLSKFMPYDRILVSAAAEEIPEELIEQLNIAGKLVVPVGDSVFELEKEKTGVKTIEHQGFLFVPLIKD